MRKIPKPQFDPEQVFLTSIDSYSDLSLKAALIACKDLVRDASDELDQKVSKGRVHTITRELIVNGTVPKATFKSIYDDKFVKHRQVRPLYYDYLLATAPLGKCPLCCYRQATTLDHYLPKAHYPRLAVAPINLVPACKDCNTGKQSEYPKAPHEETIHPYFDDIENDLWLKATVVQSDPVSINYFVSRPLRWDRLLGERVKHHFDCFHLKKMYGILAAEELSNIKLQLVRLSDSGAGTEGIQSFLREAAISREAPNINSWQAALYRGLVESNWFCAGGFRQIA